MRRCLLKGCEQRFHPRQARQRYCSEGCREAARKWSRWKAQQRYRTTRVGQEKRNGQSRRYRERVKTRKSAEPEAVSEAARVITKEHFFEHTCERPGCYEGFAHHRRGLVGIYHNVSREYLHRYLWQFDFLWNNRQLNDGERTILAVKAAEGKRLMYKDPVAEREYIKNREQKEGGEQLEPF